MKKKVFAVLCAVLILHNISTVALAAKNTEIQYMTAIDSSDAYSGDKISKLGALIYIVRSTDISYNALFKSFKIGKYTNSTIIGITHKSGDYGYYVWVDTNGDYQYMKWKRMDDVSRGD